MMFGQRPLPGFLEWGLAAWPGPAVDVLGCLTHYRCSSPVTAGRQVVQSGRLGAKSRVLVNGGETQELRWGCSGLFMLLCDSDADCLVSSPAPS